MAEDHSGSYLSQSPGDIFLLESSEIMYIKKKRRYNKNKITAAGGEGMVG